MGKSLGGGGKILSLILQCEYQKIRRTDYDKD